MKRILIILIVLPLLPLHLSGQWQLLISNPEHETAGEVTEWNNFYYSCCSFVSKEVPGKINSRIYKIDNTGNIVSDLIHHNNSYRFLSTIMSTSEGLIMYSVHAKKNTDSLRLNIATLNEDLEILNENEYSTPYKEFYLSMGIVENDSSVVLTGKCYDNDNDIILLKIINNELINTTRINIPSEQFLYDIIKKNNSSSYLLFLFSASSPSFPYQHAIVEITPNFEVVKTDTIPGSLQFYYNALPANDGYYISGKHHIFGSNPRNDEIKVMKCDTFYCVNNYVLLGASDTVDYPGIINYLSYSNNNEDIVVAGTKNADPNQQFSTQKSWYSLYLIDKNLNCKWKKFYGGDAYYMLYYMQPTINQGYILSGSRYDWTTQLTETDVFIIQTDSNGLITSNTGPGPIIQAHDAIVYPNPGREKLTIESGPQIAGAKFILYDMAGKTLIEKTLNHTTETLPTAHLPSGLYLWNITHKGKAVESGKWVKE